MTGFLPPAIIEIKAIADKAIAELKEVNKELDKMDGTTGKASAGIDRMQKASKLATGALFAMGTAFAGFAAIGIKEALEAETVMNKLGTTMSAAGLNTASNRKAVEDLASSYIDLGFADDAAAAGLEVLLRTTGDLDESQKLLALSADVARTKNIGLAEASGILAKARVGIANAFKEMGIELATTLQKSEAIAKAMEELNAKIGDQAENATKTFAVQMQIVRERFNDTAESLGTFLLPLIKNMLETINNGVKFIKEHATAFKILGGILLTVTTALAAYNAAVKVQLVITKTYTTAKAFATAVLALFTKQQQAANAAMKANPIGLVVSALTLLAGAFVMVWNRSETFRKAVIQVAKTALTAFASIIPIIGQVGETILKFVLTPMKTLLSALSHLPGVGKYAKAGLDLLNKGLDGVSDFADKASAKAKALAANLDKLNKPIKIGGGTGGIPDLGNTGSGFGGGKSAEEIKAAKEKAETIKKNNENYMKIVKELNDKLYKAQDTFNETMLDLESKYQEKVADLKANAARRIADLEKKAFETRAKLNSDAIKKQQEATNKFNETVKNLTKKKDDDLAKLAIDNEKRIADIRLQGANKLASIVQQSIDRLRNAFATGTAFNVADIFKGLVDSGTANVDNLLDSLKGKLSAAKQLAANAAALQAAGFSQTFIEQVVASGAETGNALAESILKASPETIRELQNTFGDLEKTSSTALDALGASMNTSARLATDELTKAYADAQKETADLLLEQNQQYAESMKAINDEFTDAMAQAEKDRDDTIKQIQADLAEALAAVDKELQENIAEINKDLADALAEAAKELADAQEEARKRLKDSLKEIQDEFAEKLGSVKDMVAETIAAVLALQSALTAAGSITIAPPATQGGTPTPNIYGGQDRDYDAHLRAKAGVVVNAPITNYNTTTAEDMSDTIVRVAKFGLSVL